MNTYAIPFPSQCKSPDAAIDFSQIEIIVCAEHEDARNVEVEVDTAEEIPGGPKSRGVCEHLHPCNLHHRSTGLRGAEDAATAELDESWIRTPWWRRVVGQELVGHCLGN